MSVAAESVLQRLRLEGDNNKFNDALYAPPIEKWSRTGGQQNSDVQSQTEPPSIVFYFGGDMQNFRQDFIAEQGNEYFRERYCLEATVLALRQRFKYSSVVAIQPSLMHQNIFANYVNFYSVTDKTGTPFYGQRDQALNHFTKLMTSLIAKTRSSIRTSSSSSSTSIALVGFSKGVCVLNQLLISLHHAFYNAVPYLANFPWRLTDLYFLDSGNSGREGAWMTDPFIISSLAKYATNYSPVGVHMGVTAYQLEYKRTTQPWIAAEEEVFCELIEHYSKSEEQILLKFTRLYIDCTDDEKRNKNADYIKLHFSIIDKLVDGKL